MNRHVIQNHIQTDDEEAIETIGWCANCGNSASHVSW